MKLPKLIARIKLISKNPDKLEGNLELTTESCFCKLQVHMGELCTCKMR